MTFEHERSPFDNAMKGVRLDLPINKEGHSAMGQEKFDDNYVPTEDETSIEDLPSMIRKGTMN